MALPFLMGKTRKNKGFELFLPFRAVKKNAEEKLSQWHFDLPLDPPSESLTVGQNPQSEPIHVIKDLHLEPEGLPAIKNTNLRLTARTYWAKVFAPLVAQAGHTLAQIGWVAIWLRNSRCLKA